MLREPLPQLLHEDVGVVEQAVDEIDRLAVERREPRRETLAHDLRGIATWIVDRDRLTHDLLRSRDLLATVLRSSRQTRYEHRRASLVSIIGFGSQFFGHELFFK